MTTQRWTISTIILFVGLATGFVGCGDDTTAAGDAGAGAAGSTTESPNLGDKTEKKITAADGGMVALKDAGILLDIPAGALAKDVTISAEVVSNAGLPDGKTLAGNVVEFLPKGLQFTKPVALSIDLGAVKVPKGATASIAWLDEKTNKWVDLDGSKLVGGTVTAETTHFTIFVVRFVVDASGQIVQESGQCSSGSFKACGGDIAGVWTITAGCADVPAALLQQVAAQCKGASIEVGVDIVGDVTFAAGKVTGTFNIDSMSTQVQPKSCNNITTCDMPDASDTGTTVKDTGTACETKQAQSQVKELDGTYEVSGNAVTITDPTDVSDAGTPNPPTADDYCITGNTMVVRSADTSGIIFQWTATRK
jgi:hypothetical protein